MSSLRLMPCTVPAGVHLFHDLPKLSNTALLGAVWDLIHVLVLAAPSLLWAPLAWCTVQYLPASISFMTSRSLIAVMYCACACQRPSLLWALSMHCVPASVHLFHDLPQLDSRDVLDGSISFISSLSLMHCTVQYLPASISFMTSRSLPTPPDLEPTRDLPARGLLSSKLNVLQAVKQKLHLTKK